jgi:molecular chaperone DnaK
MGRAIGIDLGTTNSCAAIIQNGKPNVLTYKDGQKTIPSVFAIDKHGNRLVGSEAKTQAADNPMNTVAAAKRLIGRSFDSKAVDQFQQVFTYELVEGESSEVLIKVSDQVFTLEQISAAILRRIKEYAEESLGEEVDQAVITVPAYFNDRQRQAVRAAGKIAGLKVLRVLNEPTAAALAYGLGRTLNQRVAIYDLGGGTFDISIIDIKDRIFEVIATGGDTFLGGVDFDDRLMQHLLGRFADDTGVDLSYDRSAVTRLRDEAEAAKIRLSSLESTRIHVPNIGEDDDGERVTLDYEIARATLEELTVDLVDRSIATCERILNEASSTREQIEEMLLVGGQSRMPIVRAKVEAFAGKPPSNRVHPDEAVAIGAAIMAHSLASKASSSDVTLLDVLPSAIGISRTDGTMHVLFSKNQPLPDYKTRTLTTSKDNQRSIMLRIFQGESRNVADNELLGTFVFSGLRQAPRGEVKVEVTFHIDSEGILNLSARDRDTGQHVESRLNLGGDEDGAKRRPRRTRSAPKRPKPTAKKSQPEASTATEAPAVQADGAAPLSAKPTFGPARTPPPATSATAVKAPLAKSESKGVFGRFFGWLGGLFSRK